ncbi:hypothetical protein K440DRAFT_664084 [Wilcoxina mikolae CBS 423.85]|nr:hypothetical protein K440DRAFT_664084 [Wilcoxina mikolae CBS 423.85]
MRCISLAAVLVGISIAAAIPYPVLLPSQSSCPNTDDFAESAYKAALKAGVDPHGPMPSDYTLKTSDFVKFSADSNTGLWMAAQGSQAVLNKRKRSTGSGVGITTYSNSDCSGDATTYFNIRYVDIYYGFTDSHSIHINTGVIDQGVERLWLRTYDGGNGCYDNLNHYVYGAPGCTKNLPDFTCFVLLKVGG